MDDEDKFEGDVSRRRPKRSAEASSMYCPPSAVSSERVAARARAAWFNVCEDRANFTNKLNRFRTCAFHIPFASQSCASAA
ncbi:MAG: hypothetical protein AB7G40_16425 [Hyphomonadaceae bacterium]